MNIRALLKDIPEVFQYILVLGIVMLLLYLCLTLTRLLGQKYGKKQYYDQPEEYAKNVPDLFATTGFRRPKRDESAAEEPNSEDGKSE